MLKMNQPMTNYKKTVYAKVTQWNKHGDHKEVGAPFSFWKLRCNCGNPNMSQHGCTENSDIVCPGNFIVEYLQGCKHCGGELVLYYPAKQPKGKFIGAILCKSCGKDYNDIKDPKTGEIRVLTQEELTEEGWMPSSTVDNQEKKD